MKICIIGLGYVGLPLAHAFSAKYEVVGYDISSTRVAELKDGIDNTLELSTQQLNEAIANGIQLTSNTSDIEDCNIYIITVPTPIDKNKNPDLSPLINSSTEVGRVLKPNDIVIYESTVYPGATEELCVPILEKNSGLIFNTEFYCGYSPERINPGDKEHKLQNIIKVTSGSDQKTAKKVNELYSSIISAGTHLASSIKVAEAAKVIENTQRDLNIAFINELAIIFNKLNIDTTEVLNAASTKWNFLNFQPGLVGGHCIGVDPYYLTYKSEKVGYKPKIILSGREINDNMSIYIANRFIKLLLKKFNKVDNLKVLILGITFKENCPDIRNSKVVDLFNEIKDFGCKVDIFDPLADKAQVMKEYAIKLETSVELSRYDGVVLAVPHKEFSDLILDKKQAIFDIKSFLTVYDERL